MSEETLAQASEHARAGRYDLARTLLEPLTEPASTDVAALDLLARVRAQQGDLVGADATWQRVLDVDPEHQGARVGQGRIRRTWVPGPRRSSPRLGTAAVAVVLLGAGAGAFWMGDRQDHDNAPASSEVAALRDETSAIAGDVDRLRGAENEDREAARATARLRKALDDPRWGVRSTDGITRVVFDDPVFGSGSDVISAEGRSTLLALAQRLRKEGAVITVTGHVGPPAQGVAESGNHSATLGLARALAAAGVLVESGVDRDAVSAVTGGDLSAPFPAQDDRNQTVTLELDLGRPR